MCPKILVEARETYINGMKYQKNVCDRSKWKRKEAKRERKIDKQMNIILIINNKNSIFLLTFFDCRCMV